MRLRGFVGTIALLAALALPGSAHAAFHLMEIEQVIGGVNGDTSAQAVQLKMRLAGQQFLSGNAQLVVRDAAGMNPVTLSIFPLPNKASGACRELLLATAEFEFKTNPPLTATKRDYLMTAKIPASYLAAGTLTFEGIGNPTPWWRTSWGGAAYSGPHTAVAGASNVANDLNGNTSPAFAGPLPSTTLQALVFNPPCATQSLNNAADYRFTTEGAAAVFRNNALETFTVMAPPEVPVFPGSAGLLLVVALGALAGGAAVMRRRFA